jgi:hypothetical protein
MTGQWRGDDAIRIVVRMTQPLRSRLEGTLHECSSGCMSADQGHALSPIQERVASATPSKWADAVVTTVAASGWVEVMLLSDDSVVVLWNHADLTDELEIGAPVALHSVYDVLAIGDSKHNVLRASF